jgi:hypothetical protein
VRGESLRRSLLLFGSLAVVALWVIASSVIEGIGNSPDGGEGQALLRYFQEDEISLYAGGIVLEAQATAV